MKFDDAFKIIFNFEGDYSNDPADKDGAIINAINATVSNEGRISPTPNTLTSSGIIFR